MAIHRSAASARLRPRRHRLLGALAAVLAPLLAACGAGFQAQTNQIYQPGPGISVRDGGVYALNAQILTDGKGNGTLVAALINQVATPDTLESVSLQNRAGKQLDATILSSTIALPSQRSVQLASTGDVRITGDLAAGTYATLSLFFRNAKPIEVGVPVVATAPMYDGVPLGPVPTPTTPSHSP